MAKRTFNYSVMPWQGGLVTSTDELLISGSQLTVADNVIADFNHAKRRRDGINYNWDNTVFEPTERESSGTVRTLTGSFSNVGILVGDRITLQGSANTQYNQMMAPVLYMDATTLSYEAPTEYEESTELDSNIIWGNKVIGGIDYWFGSEDSKAQFIISVLDNGAVYRTAQGARNRVVDTGTPWTIPSTGLTEANLEVLQNRVVIAVSGLNNRMKYWDGDVSNTLQDLYSNLILTSVSRASTGTIRTLVFNNDVDLPLGAEIYINGGPSTYNGKFTLASGDNTSTITYDAGSALTEDVTPDEEITIGVVAPLALFVREHMGRLFCNDKTRLDRLHYSSDANVFQWGGIGTSGALDIGEGDGDPNGLTGISPTFKGDLFVGKRTKLYRVRSPDGDFDLADVIKVSNGIGFLSHQGVVGIDQDDLYFVSDRGMHSMATTSAYGDYTAAYLSKDIQDTFVDSFTEARKRFIKAAYLPQINSAVFSVAEGGSPVNNSLYIYNIPNKEWYRWPNIEAETLISAQDPDRRRVYLGTYQARLASTLTQASVDTGFNGSIEYIFSRLATGLIMVDQRPDTVKGFMRVRLIYRGEGSYVITCKVKVDNFSEQAVSFSNTFDGKPLGAFMLGVDLLGGSRVTAPYSLPIDGHGRAIKLTIEQSDLNTKLAIQGFMIEYTGGTDAQETRLGDNS